MSYDYMKEVERIQNNYKKDPLQKRFSALICGETNAGKTYILRTARLPIHVDSFDPGGTKNLRDLEERGLAVIDTQWENEDPYNPTAFAEWMKSINIRKQIGYFEHFGTYCLDSATTFGDAIMNYAMGQRSGEVPKRNIDYMPQKIHMQNYLRSLMNIPCDFIMTAHLKEHRKTLAIDSSTGIRREEVYYRFRATGQAVVTIPLLFDEIYVIIGKDGRGSEPKREMLIDSLGTYIARSRLKKEGKLNATEEPDIKKLLKKAGFSTKDKPPIGKEVKQKQAQ